MKYLSNRYLLSLFSFICYGVSLFAETFTSDPVGYVALEGDSGGYILSSPFLKNAIFSGSISPISTTVIESSSNIPTLADKSFVQVTSGTHKGVIVDVASVSGNFLTLATPLSLSLGDTIVIRPHFLIEDLGDAFVDGTSVTVYDSSGSSTTASYRDNFLGTGWLGDSDTPIYPGEGFVLNTPGALSVTITGDVSTEPVIFSASSGVTNLVGTLNPTGANAEEIFAPLPGSSSISVYEQGGSLTSPTVYSKAPDFLGGAWTPSLSQIDFGEAFATVVIPSADTAIELPAMNVPE